jgi:hypothetical protein
VVVEGLTVGQRDQLIETGSAAGDLHASWILPASPVEIIDGKRDDTCSHQGERSCVDIVIYDVPFGCGVVQDAIGEDQYGAKLLRVRIGPVSCDIVKTVVGISVVVRYSGRLAFGDDAHAQTAKTVERNAETIMSSEAFEFQAVALAGGVPFFLI